MGRTAKHRKGAKSNHYYNIFSAVNCDTKCANRQLPTEAGMA